jgi:hypothetical protein
MAILLINFVLANKGFRYLIIIKIDLIFHHLLDLKEFADHCFIVPLSLEKIQNLL